MTSTQKKLPPIVNFGAFLLSLITFIVGFWHAHLGLKSFNLFGSEYGSLTVAGIILILILLSYFIALNGKKSALLFYVIGGLLFFLFNLNYFYPAYLGDKLVKEEAVYLNDTLQSYTNKVSKLQNDEVVNEILNLKELKGKISSEIEKANGFGPVAKNYLNQFNDILSKREKTDATRKSVRITPSYSVGKTQKERDGINEDVNKQLETAISTFEQKYAVKGKENALKLYEGIKEMNRLKVFYSPKLDEIIKGDFTVNLDSMKSDKNVKTLKELGTQLNNIIDQINNAQGERGAIKLQKVESQSENIGKFEHTIASVSARIGKIDTWGIIFLCLFLDLLVPLFIYIMIRQKDDDGEGGFGFSFLNSGGKGGKNRPSSF